MNINVHFKREGKKNDRNHRSFSNSTTKDSYFVDTKHCTKRQRGSTHMPMTFSWNPQIGRSSRLIHIATSNASWVPYCWVIELWLVRRGLLIMVPHRWVYPIKMNCSPWTWIRGFQQQAQSSRTCCSYNSIRWPTHFSHQNTKYLKEEIDLVKLEF